MASSRVQDVRRLFRNYLSELMTTFVIIVMICVWRVYPLEFSDFQRFTATAYVMFMVLGVVIMFNTGQTRESAAELLELQKGGDDDTQ